MSKFTDYKRSAAALKLLVKMGIMQLPDLPDRFDAAILLFYQSISKTYAPLYNEKILFDSNGLIMINGIRCCVYQKEQNRDRVDLKNKISNYTYHLCNCKEIQGMLSSKIGAYVATARSGGVFNINVLYTRKALKHSKTKLLRKSTHELRMSLCDFCKNTLLERGLIKEDFSLQSFYEQCQTNIPPGFMDNFVPYAQSYVFPPEELPVYFRILTNFKCQLCKVDCSIAPELLYLYYKDHNTLNNNSANLTALCACCHSWQPGNENLKNDVKYIEQIKKVEILRKEQGLTP